MEVHPTEAMKLKTLGEAELIRAWMSRYAGKTVKSSKCEVCL